MVQQIKKNNRNHVVLDYYLIVEVQSFIHKLTNKVIGKGWEKEITVFTCKLQTVNSEASDLCTQFFFTFMQETKHNTHMNNLCIQNSVYHTVLYAHY